jgi:hypothetical protein
MNLVFIALGGFVLALIGVAMLVAAWEFLQDRDAEHRLLRDRAAFAASSAMPLAGSGPEAGKHRTALSGALAGIAAMPAGRTSRFDANWIETRPTILNCPPSAAARAGLAQPVGSTDSDTQASAPAQPLRVDLPLG